MTIGDNDRTYVLRKFEIGTIRLNTEFSKSIHNSALPFPLVSPVYPPVLRPSLGRSKCPTGCVGSDTTVCNQLYPKHCYYRYYSYHNYYHIYNDYYNY